MEDYLKNILPEEITKLLDELMYCLVFVADKENIYEGQLFSMYENLRELRNEFAKLSDPQKLSLVFGFEFSNNKKS